MSEWTDEETESTGARGASQAWDVDPQPRVGPYTGSDAGAYTTPETGAYAKPDSWAPFRRSNNGVDGNGHDEVIPLDEIDTFADEGSSQGRELRRLLLGGVAGVAMLVGPILIANAIVPNQSDVDTEQDTALVAMERLRETTGIEDQGRTEALAAQTTTTTAPTTTTTTLPPTTTTTAPPTTTTAPEPVPPVDAGSGQLGDPYYLPTWDALADCEAGGNWHINTGNGYYGGLQFSLSSWQGVGGTGYPHEHSRETQIAMGQRLWESSGWGAWPACTRELGWR